MRYDFPFYTIKAVHIEELHDRVREALGSLPITPDGLASLSYDTTSNRITTTGFAYDAAGNQVRALISTGASQRFQYDAANRLVKVKADDNVTVLASYTYGDSNERLIADEGGFRTAKAAQPSPNISRAEVQPHPRGRSLMYTSATDYSRLSRPMVVAAR